MNVFNTDYKIPETALQIQTQKQQIIDFKTGFREKNFRRKLSCNDETLF